MVAREPAPDFAVTDHSGNVKQVPAYIETLPGGPQHAIIEADRDSGALDTTHVLEAPPGHYFVTGDNRDNSPDCRLPAASGAGFAPLSQFTGRADWIVFSPGGEDMSAAQKAKPPAGLRIGWERLFRRVF